MSEQCTTKSRGTVYDFREVDDSEIWVKQLYTMVQEGDRLLYKDAEFLVVNVPMKQDECGSLSGPCENCSFSAKNLEKRLLEIGSKSYQDNLEKLEEWGLVKSSGRYDFHGPCVDSPHCVAQNGDEFNYICTKSNVPWFVPSIGTESNLSRESEQPS